MIIISHRGNLEGSNPSTENSPEAIEIAIGKGFDVEVDVWCEGDVYFLGHDSPNYKVSKEFLLHPSLWCHAKNIQAMEKMHEDGIHHFWHENDLFTITSKGVPWSYPSNYHKRGIVVLKESIPPLLPVLGICTDEPVFFRELFAKYNQEALSKF